jgi:hypothetical protein
VDREFVDRVVAVARGESSEAEVTVPTRILFLKSMVLNGFQARMRKTCPDYYLSPRRQARMLELLRLEALLDGRDSVNQGDLKALRFMVGILNGDQHETEAFDRCLEELLRFFEVDPRLKTTCDVLAAAFDVTRAPALDGREWSDLKRLCDRADAREELKPRPSVESLYRFLDRLNVPFVPLDELRRGCLDLLRPRLAEG